MTCAFVACAESTSNCALVDGCLWLRFAAPTGRQDAEAEKPRGMKLNGTKPARTNRDPMFIKRHRKALTK